MMSTSARAGSLRNENCVKYKFKSALDYSTVYFSGNYISVADLRRQIIQDNRLVQNPDYTLQIRNQDTKHVYDGSEQTLIPANTQLTVVRIPITEPAPAPVVEVSSGKRKIGELYPDQGESESNVGKWNYANYGQGYADNGHGYGYGYTSYGDGYQNYGADYAGQPVGDGYTNYSADYASQSSAAQPNISNLKEIPQERIRWVSKPIVTRKRSTSVTETESGSAVAASPVSQDTLIPTTPEAESVMPFRSNRHHTPPKQYRCYKCNAQGHWIRDCPLHSGPGEPGVTTIKTTGIPRSALIIVEDGSVKGAKLTPDGRYAVPAVDLAAYQTHEAARSTH